RRPSAAVATRQSADHQDSGDVPARQRQDPAAAGLSEGHARGVAPDRAVGRSLRAAYLISTSPTWLVRLLAVTGLPSGVTSMLRTMSPPPGMAQLWNFSV